MLTEAQKELAKRVWERMRDIQVNFLAETDSPKTKLLMQEVGRVFLNGSTIVPICKTEALVMGYYDRDYGICCWVSDLSEELDVGI